MRLSLSFYLSLFVSAPLYATPWEQVSAPTHNMSSSIGSYANGCLDGAGRVPLGGTG
ncbi:penicillin-insensitive murein endopeptidase, partial [Vibrio alginolyticus]|nr:penicillin-insensitive murein endopeptidase [Vibrio alginolyticus]MDW2234178.1 penicillin-insensitive murein endopeptidase [Vibrio sp. 2091]